MVILLPAGWRGAARMRQSVAEAGYLTGEIAASAFGEVPKLTPTPDTLHVLRTASLLPCVPLTLTDGFLFPLFRRERPGCSRARPRPLSQRHGRRHRGNNPHPPPPPHNLPFLPHATAHNSLRGGHLFPRPLVFSPSSVLSTAGPEEPDPPRRGQGDDCRQQACLKPGPYATLLHITRMPRSR